MKITFLATAATLLLGSVLSVAPAQASLVLDTGAPPSGATGYTFNSSQAFADEFYLSAGETLTQLGAYLSAANPGSTAFTFDLYAPNTPFSSYSVTSATLKGDIVYSDTGSYSASGWNYSTANYTATASGYYWLAIQTSSPNVFTAPTVGTQPNGTAPAAAFMEESGGKFITTTTADAGMQVSAVPLPAAGLLFGSGLLGFGGLLRRRRTGIAA